MRIKNTIRNSSWAFISQAISIIFSFINRIILIRILGIEYVGINGLFKDILYLLSIAEMGISYALMYEMYKPMHLNDSELLNQIVFYYQRLYTKIGLFIGAIGLLITPFLYIIVPDIKPIENIQLIYIVFVLNSLVSYFFMSRKSLLNVAQKNYIEQIIVSIICIFQFIMQLFCLLITKNFFLYVSCCLICTLLTSLLIVKVTNKIFPFIRMRLLGGLSPAVKKRVSVNMRALFISNTSGVIFSATDSIIISNICGLRELGILTNYTMIINYLNMIIRLGVNAVTASIGDLNAEKESREVFAYYKKTFFLIYAIISIFSISFYNLCNDFIETVFGQQYLLSKSIIIFLMINMYILNIRLPALVFRNVMGIFKYDKYKGIPEIALNITISIILAKYIGLLGVIIGTTISQLFVSCWIEPYMLYKHGFRIEFFDFIKDNFRFLFIFILGFLVSVMACSFIPLKGFLAFFIKMSVCFFLIFSNIILWFRKTDEYIYFKKHLLKYLKL
jgi:O-antigen/teichoic acid export membrane protein